MDALNDLWHAVAGLLTLALVVLGCRAAELTAMKQRHRRMGEDHE